MKHKERYLLAICILITIVLYLLYPIVSGSYSNYFGSLKELTISLFPELIGPCVVFCILIVWYSWTNEEKTEEKVSTPGQLNIEDFNTHLDKLSQVSIEFDRIINPQSLQVSGFQIFENYKMLPWNKIIDNAQKVDVVAYYLHSWVQNHFSLFTNFFSRGGSFRIVLPDPEDDVLINYAQRRFPKLTNDRLKENIHETVRVLQRSIKTSDNHLAEFRPLVYDDIFNYAIIIVDMRYLSLTVFEHFSKVEAKSPIFFIDLEDSQNEDAKLLRQFWIKEIGQIIENSKSYNTSLL